jgi:hypothetical protein
LRVTVSLLHPARPSEQHDDAEQRLRGVLPCASERAKLFNPNSRINLLLIAQMCGRFGTAAARTHNARANRLRKAVIKAQMLMMRDQ